MASLTETYLLRLNKRLARKWPANEALETVNELRAHLAESINTLTSEGHDNPETEALKRIGSDKLLAENLIRAKSGIDKRSVWRIGWLPATLTAVLTVLPISLEYVDHSAFGFLVEAIHWFTYFFLASFVFACWRSRRMLWQPMAAALVASVLVSVAGTFTFGAGGFTQGSVQNRADMVRMLGRNVAQYEADEALALRGTQGALSGLSRAPVSTMRVTQYGLGYLPLSLYSTQETDVVLQPISDPVHAKQLWKENGGAFLTKVHGELAQERKNLDRWAHFSVRASDVTDVFARLGLWALWSVAFLTIFNALLIGAAATRQRLLKTMWRPERLGS